MKCQYQHRFFILINKVLKIFIFIIIIINIKYIPKDTWNIWNEVNKKNIENKIELFILKFNVLYSINWIRIKYILIMIVIIMNLLFIFFLVLFLNEL